MSKQIIKTPGKLYIAGEYAVVSGEEAILMPTAKTIDITIEPNDYYLLNNKQITLNDTSLQLTNTYLYNAIQTAHNYLSEVKPYALNIQSHLKLEHYPKLGLGTSGALTIGVINAITRVHGKRLTPLHLYKLGVIAQIDKIKHSSFGDLATSAYQHWIRYQMPNTTWLIEELKNDSLINLINKEWPDLMIQSIEPIPYPMLVIYTKQPANSTALVTSVMVKKETQLYQRFLDQSKQYLNQITKARSYTHFAEAIQALQSNFETLSILSDTILITPEMKKIEQLVQKHKGVMKFSGAGGGDCVLAYFPTHNDYHQAHQTIKHHFPILNSFFKGV